VCSSDLFEGPRTNPVHQPSNADSRVPRCRVPATVRPNVVVAQRDVSQASTGSDVRRSTARPSRASTRPSEAQQHEPAATPPARRPKSAAIGATRPPAPASTASAPVPVPVIQRVTTTSVDQSRSATDSLSNIDIDELLLELQDRVLAEIDRRGGRYGGMF